MVASARFGEPPKPTTEVANRVIARTFGIYITVRGSAITEDPTGWPVTGGISQLAFCAGPSAACPSHWEVLFRSGLDIGAPLGTPVAATHSGQVFKFVEFGPAPPGWRVDGMGYGISVVIVGTTYTTVYGHFQAVSPCVATAADGGFIEGGTLIGYVDSTGVSGGDHLHYQINMADGFNAPYGHDLDTLADFDALVPAYSLGGAVTTSYPGAACP